MPKRVCSQHYRARMQTYLCLLFISIVCASLCAECTTELPTDCLECIDDPFVYHDLLSDTCKCVISTFLEDRACKPCHPYCDKCDGDSNYNCLPNSCNYLEDSYPYTISNPKTCLLRCEGTESPLYVDHTSTPMQCKPCHPNCRVCNDDTPKDCVECEPPYMLTSSRDCLHTSCPTGSLPHERERICLPCHEGCAECVGAVDACTVCGVGYYMEEGFCVVECSIGYLGVVVGGVEACVACPPRCLSCMIDAHTDTPTHTPTHTSTHTPTFICLHCFELYYLLQGECLSRCPIGLFEDDKHRICTQCSEACLTCTGPDANDCLLCNYFKGYGPAGEKSNECVQEQCELNQFYNSKYQCQCNAYSI